MKELEFNNVKFYVGQSAKENWQLLDKAKIENKNFVWFHLDSFPSPYVFMWSSISNLEKLIKESKEVNSTNIDLCPTIDQYINYGATLCKEYSKYKFLNDLKIMYTTVSKLKKTDIVGEVDIKGKSKIIKL
uniref:NFACT RNA-binding domain-containing protein n=1 Tax=viral metagenome TaxID=1070528 RepID=A0A6C0AYK3_9ZZZZ|tara:strand:+ start:96 stop:488 length:393 start_codon:yes stop_codon:yes gene_type:complete